MTAEFANEKQRKRSITIMVAEYPLGVIFGGIAGAIVGVIATARYLCIGAVVSALMLPVVWLCTGVDRVPKQKPDDSTLSKINVVLKKPAMTASRRYLKP